MCGVKRRIFESTAILAGLCLAGGLANAETLDLPERQSSALGGRVAADLMTDLEREDREAEIYNQIAQGNIPDFIRELVPITVPNGNENVVYYVTPEYMAIGSDADYFLMPMTPLLAQWLNALTGTFLPTPKMVDQIHAAAPLKMNPTPIPPSPAMITMPVFADHNTTVWGQRSPQLNTHPLGTLVGGHKKDVVITSRLATTPSKVAIYGWHYPNGSNIQPLYLGHADFYADYSHGIRFVDGTVSVGASSLPFGDVIGSSQYASLISGEGVITQPYYITGDAPELAPFIDNIPSGGRELVSWKDRFKTHTVSAFSPTAPGGDGFVLTVADTSGGIDTARIGFQLDGDYTVEAMIYCDYRPGDAGDGYERVGIFARDDGNGMFEGISGSNIRGNNYALTWDSNDGRVRCLRTVEGEPTDLLSSTVTRAETAWRTFRMSLNGSTIQFQLDGELILEVEDTTHERGSAGIGYHDYFTTNANIRGTRADRFKLTRSSGPNNWVVY